MAQGRSVELMVEVHRDGHVFSSTSTTACLGNCNTVEVKQVKCKVVCAHAGRLGGPHCR